MIVDYLVFKPEYTRELCEMWESACGEFQLPAYFEERQTECAFTDGELVGCALFESREGLAWCRLAVREDSRGCGVGRRLLVNLCQRAKARGCASVLVWGVPKGDKSGIALLADEGFRRVGKIEGGANKEDFYLYQKML